jgi:UDP-N-acetylmuramoyl-L-alanyl-D-glutamate--2,6-diaminopimelate ligase
VAALVEGAIEGPDGQDIAVHGVSLSSNDIVPGDLYAALPGANVHGASYAAAAVDAGAVAVLTDADGATMLRTTLPQVPRVVVASPRAVVGSVASLLYGTRELPFVLFGVTGTNGKTTTAYLMNSALEALGQTTGLIGTVETRIGHERLKSVRTTPEATVLHALLAVMSERGVDACVMEVSSHALSQHRVDGVVYDVALFTNLSQDHLDFHPTMRDYFEAKASLFTPERSRRGVVCVDDEWGRELARTCGVPVTTVTSVPDVAADWRITAQDPDGGFTLSGPEAALHLRSALPGDFNTVNTAMAALALLASGIPRDQAERALSADPHVPGRMQRVGVPAPQELGLPEVVVDYAHTPEAVAAALRALRPSTRGSLVVVLGAGGDRDRGKRAAMGRAAAEHADQVFVTDDNPRTEDPAAIRAAILAGAVDATDSGNGAVSGAGLRDIAGRQAAIVAAVEAAYQSGPGGVVAIVGKGHETGQEISGTVYPFDDVTEATTALSALLDRVTRTEGRG